MREAVEQIFVNNSIRPRMALGLVGVTAVGGIGLWILGMWLRESADDDAEVQETLVLGLMMVAIAIFGALRLSHYGYKSVVGLDAEEATGRARVTLWRPLGTESFDTRLANIVEWRYEVARKNTRMPIHRFRARTAAPMEQWLLFEVSPRIEMHPLFRKVASDAVDEFEHQTGIAYLRGGPDAAS